MSAGLTWTNSRSSALNRTGTRRSWRIWTLQRLGLTLVLRFRREDRCIRERFMLLGVAFLLVIGISISLDPELNRPAKPQDADLIETSGVGVKKIAE